MREIYEEGAIMKLVKECKSIKSVDPGTDAKRMGTVNNNTNFKKWRVGSAIKTSKSSENDSAESYEQS